jgi:hypothetical protein
MALVSESCMRCVWLTVLPLLIHVYFWVHCCLIYMGLNWPFLKDCLTAYRGIIH